jgi:SOS1/NGEF-like PH domain
VRFVREGSISHWNAKEKRVKPKHFFLFNRCLLVCKKEGNSKFWLKVYITLRPTIKVVDVEDSTYSRPGCEFRLYAPKKTFIFFASTPATKDGWLKDINDCINGRVPEMRSQSSAMAAHHGGGVQRRGPPTYGGHTTVGVALCAAVVWCMCVYACVCVCMYVFSFRCLLCFSPWHSCGSVRSFFAVLSRTLELSNSRTLSNCRELQNHLRVCLSLGLLWS